ncbi:MAG: thioesterase family protein [Actinomycetales bacterium]|uniref:Thioesterase family protein n=1 Tax=Candidatus Phosphoribacter hodrii TaxID=2953743 RepID=A0A935MIT8_9MICO|nr:thioesterase family protein [Candidatus Phosphoribacter hodrii]
MSSRSPDGRSFSTWRVSAHSTGTLLAIVTASFQEASPGFGPRRADARGAERREPPNVAGSGRCPRAVCRGLHPRRPHRAAARRRALPAGRGRTTSRDKGVWLRSRRPMPDDPIIHAAVLAYASDYPLLEPVLRRHGVAWRDPRLRPASLDHAMWFHRPGRADEWVLHAGHSPSSPAGAGSAWADVCRGRHLARLDRPGRDAAA